MKLWLMMLLCANTTILYCVNSFDPIDPVAMQAVHGAQRYIPLVGPGVTTSQGIMADKLNYSANAGAGLFTINTSGYYYLADDLILSQTPSNTNPIILINASNVVLDLGTKTIAGNGNANTVLAGIQIANGISNVTVKNGVINGISSATSNANGFGVLVNTSAASTVSHIILQDLSIFTCGLGVAVRKCNDLILSDIECTSNGPALNAAGSAFGYMGSLYLETVNGCRIKNSTFSNSGWQFAGSAGAVHILGGILSSCLDIEITDSHFDNNTNDTSNTASGVYALGLYLLNTSNCTITNATASNNTRSVAVGNSCIGILIQGASTGNVFTNCKSNNNTGTSSCYGFSVESSSTGSNGNIFVDCMANLNTCTGTGATAAAVAVYGFNVSSSQSNQFKNCVANMNNVPSTATLTATTAISVYGFLLNNADSTQFINCVANSNNLSSTATVPATITAKVYGFYNLNCSSNSFISCQANGNNVPGGNNAGVTRTTIGFYSAGCFSNQFIQCTAARNNISTSSADPSAYNAANFQAVSFSHAAGFQLGDNPSTIETGALISHCISNNNQTLVNGTKAIAYGILILPWPANPVSITQVSNGNIIEYCKVYSNFSQTSFQTTTYPIRGPSGGNISTINPQSQGIIDMTPGNTAGNFAGGGAVTTFTPAALSGVGSTTLLRSNVSYNHGICFNQTVGNRLMSFYTSNNTAPSGGGPSSVNYYIDYPTNFTGGTQQNANAVIYDLNIGATNSTDPTNIITAAQAANTIMLANFSYARLSNI